MVSCFTNCTVEFKAFLNEFASTALVDLLGHSNPKVVDMASCLRDTYSDSSKDAWGFRDRNLSITISEIVSRIDGWQEEIEEEQKIDSTVLEGVTIDGKPVMKGEW